LEADLEPLPMARVENTPRTGDEKYSPSGGKSAGGSEDDGSGDELDEDTFYMLNEEELPGPRRVLMAPGVDGKVNFVV